ncbi:MAG: hypothetical protein CVU87_10445 [Firmicutes bacterium HGW-Firmicutes-12]|jgi:hypothetical protein|nr:MAG: hypothetical protein CVU87_10445 [Firmicutes bacterium HGW-Firmicutes-12]
MDKNKFKAVKNDAEKNYKTTNIMDEEFASELNEENIKKNLSTNFKNNNQNKNQNKNYKEDNQK